MIVALPAANMPVVGRPALLPAIRFRAIPATLDNGAAAVLAIKALAVAEGAPAELAAHLCAEFSGKYERATASTQQKELRIGFARRLRQAAIDTQRQELIRIWQDDQISDDVLHHIEEDLDYHESHL